MCKVSHFSVTNQENPEKILLQSVINLPMEAHMNSMTLSSFGGLTILCEEERHLSIASQLASCITDRRRKYLVHHSLEEIIFSHGDRFLGMTAAMTQVPVPLCPYLHYQIISE